MARLAWAQIYLGDHQTALDNIEKASKIDSNSGEVLFLHGAILNYIGEPKKAGSILQQALKVDSFVSPSWDVHVGLSNILLNDYENAITALNRATERAPAYVPPYVFKAWALAELGKHDDSQETVKSLMEIAPNVSIEGFSRMLPFKSSKPSGRLVEALRSAGLPDS